MKCPWCRKELKQVYKWETISTAHLYDLESGGIQCDVDRADGSDHEAWTCFECDEDLPPETVGKIEKLVF